MQIVTKYRANDGSEWSTEEAAQKRDVLLAEIDAALTPLKPRPDDSNFVNGHGYLQHDAAAVMAAKTAIVTLALRETRHPVFQHPADEIHPFSIAGRILDDTGGPLYAAWGRFMCMDTAGREWGQPYYAQNPTQGEQVCVG